MSYCANCGSFVNDNASFCPSCGAPNKNFASAPDPVPSPAPAYGPVKEKKGSNDIAIVALVAAFVLTPIVGLILSIIAKSNIKKYDYEKPYNGLATAALVISIVGLVLALLGLLIFAVVMIINLVALGGLAGSGLFDQLFNSLSDIQYYVITLF